VAAGQQAAAPQGLLTSLDHAGQQQKDLALAAGDPGQQCR